MIISVILVFEVLQAGCGSLALKDGHPKEEGGVDEHGEDGLNNHLDILYIIIKSLHNHLEILSIIIKSFNTDGICWDDYG